MRAPPASLPAGLAVGLGLGLLLALAPAQGARAQDEPLEYAVKATYLHKLTAFVRWPEAAFETATSPIRLCVVGDDPFGSLLDRAVRGQKVGGRAFAVLRLPTARPEVGCHVAYLAGSARQTVTEALAGLQGRPVLTVTDAAVGGAAMGTFHFVVQDDRVRFAIDNQQAAESALEISSKLLDLAVSVRPRERAQ